MKKMAKFSVIALIAFWGTTGLAQESASPTSSGLFVEPAITYETGSTSINYPSPLSDSSGDVTGFGLGARLGVHLYEAFFVGLDGRYSIPEFSDSSTSYKADAKVYNWGPMVGVQMPDIGLRVWAAYVLGGELDPEKSGSYNVKFAQAKGYRIGAGFRLASVSLNLEYQDLKYDRTTLQEVGPFSPGANFDGVKLKSDTWVASVSFPIELYGND